MKNVDDIDVERVIDQVVKKRNFRKALKKSAEICEKEGVEVGFTAFFRNEKIRMGKVVRGGCTGVWLEGSMPPGYFIDREGVLFMLHFHPQVINEWSLGALLPSPGDIEKFFPPGVKWSMPELEEEGLRRIERDLEWREEIETMRRELEDEYRQPKYQIEVEAVAGVSERRNCLIEVTVLFLWLKEKPAWKEILERYPDEGGASISFSDGIKILKNAFEVKIEKFRFLLKNTRKGGDAYEKRQKNTKKNPE